MSEHDLLPLADAGLLHRHARRTALARRVVSLALLAALAACAALVLVHSGGTRSRRQLRPTLIVLDVSGSIVSEASPRIRHLLETVAAHSPDGAGLVLFSDTAYLALPPTLPSHELLAYTRYFRNGRGPQLEAAPGNPPTAARNEPWADFTDGTSLSTGLATARIVLARARIRTADVVVASDFLDDTMDTLRLRRELQAYAHTPGLSLSTLELLPASLPPGSPTALALFRQYLPASLRPYRPQASTPGRSERGSAGVGASLTPGFLLAACLLIALLAAHGLVGAQLSWGDGR